MRRKLVYLPELDSVQKSKTEVLNGQFAMYDAIVNQGSCVVVSFNQLTDSFAFLGPIISERSESLMDSYIELFENESLKISRYVSPDGKRAVRTAAQYVLNSLETAINAEKKSSTFIFSSLPIAKDNIPALQRVYDSVKYSDLSLLNSIPGIPAPDCTYIKRYVKWILELSVRTSYYIDEKKEPYLTFIDYMSAILSAKDTSVFGNCLPGNFSRAQQLLLRAKPQEEKHVYARSNWLNALSSMQEADNASIALSKAMVNLCYNLSVEASISGISKNYHTDIAAFPNVFGTLISQKYITDENRKKEVLTIELCEFPDWAYTVRITNESYKIMAREQKKEKMVTQNVWKRICKSGQYMKLGKALAFYLIFLVIELISGKFESAIDWIGNEWFQSLFSNPLIRSIIYSVIVTTFISMLSSYVSRKVDLPDITDIFQNMKEFGKDFHKFLSAEKNCSIMERQ